MAAEPMLAFADLPAGDGRWAAALPVLRLLRPHLTAPLLDQVLREGGPQGLRFTAALEDGQVVGVAGWRVQAGTAAIRHLYVDDLVTVEGERRRGIGAALIEELRRRGRAAGASTIELDSGVQRFFAHRFYQREGFRISAHHFEQDLDDPAR